MDAGLVILSLTGAVLGFVSLWLARVLIKQRGETPTGRLITGGFAIFFWIAIGVLVGTGIWWLDVDWIRAAELLLLVGILISLSLVDAKIRKIPNQLLLALIVLKIAVLAVGIATKEIKAASVLWNVAGAVLGWTLFALTARLGLPAGWGDVKLAAVTGFYLKIVGLIQAMLVMSFVILIYGLVLIITKKGNFKSSVAYGPALSVGVVVTTILPLADRLL